jgi:hypothetical protein
MSFAVIFVEPVLVSFIVEGIVCTAADDVEVEVPVPVRVEEQGVRIGVVL